MTDASAAIYYGIIAWLLCWLVDLLTIITHNSPVAFEALLKAVIVIVCLVFIFHWGYGRKWFW